MSKTDSAGTTSYKRAGASVTGSLLGSTVSTTTHYTPGVSSRVGSDSTFLHSGIKNADTQTDDGGDTTASRQYDAFGNPLATTGTWQGPFGYGGPYGYQTDPDHALMLLGHRYYEPDTGRFLTRDPIKDGRNWYGYCGGSPNKSSDQDGLQVTSIIAGSLLRGPTITIGVHNHLFGHTLIRIDYADRRGVVFIENIKFGNIVVGDWPSNPTHVPAKERTLPFDRDRFPHPQDVIRGLPSEYGFLTKNCCDTGLMIWEDVTGETLLEGGVVKTPGQIEKHPLLVPATDWKWRPRESKGKVGNRSLPFDGPSAVGPLPVL